MEKKGPDHYRYTEHLDESGVTIQAETYTVIGETPKCWYIVNSSFLSIYAFGREPSAEWLKRHRKRVLKDQDYGRRFAYTDRRLALFSLMQRKRFQLSRMRHQMHIAQLAYDKAAQLLEDKELYPEKTIRCGHDDYTAGLSYSEY